MIKPLLTTLGVLAIGTGFAGADDKAKTETVKKTKIEGKTAVSKKAAAVPAALKGKLIELKDGKIQDATIAADKEYYVLYHSASW